MHYLEHLIDVAKGKAQGDLLLKNVQLVNVYSGEIYGTDVVVAGERIAAIGSGYSAREELDLNGQYLAPGFIDGHVHIESSMMEVPEFARAVVPLGTTSVVADPHEIANVLGYEGIRYMLYASKYNPLNVFFMMPSCVPSTDLETSGSLLRAFDILPLFKERWVLGLGEVMNFKGVIEKDEQILDKIKIALEKRIDGHAPALSGKELNAYIAAGIRSDHECTTVEEALEKLRLGMYVMIREGTFIKNLEDLLPVVTPENSRRCFFVTDDRHPNDILHEGHVNYMVKRAIKFGLDPVTAIRMGSTNTAEYFGLRDLGGIRPGNYADLIVINNFDEFQITHVFKNGQLVARDGKPIYEKPVRPDSKVRSAINIKWLKGDEFKIPVEGEKARIMGLVKDQALTEMLIEPVPSMDGHVVSDKKRDILRLYVIERHRASGNIGKGLVHGFGLQRGAIASSIAHDSHNIIVIGDTDEEIMRAVVHLNKIGGGIVVVEGNEILETLELPIAGLMSREPLEPISRRIEALIRATRKLGCTLKDPLMALSFLALPVIPRLKLTDMGLVDVETFSHVRLFV